MKKSDYIFLTISIIFALAFIVNLIFQVLPEKQAVETSSIVVEESLPKPTGLATNIDKIKAMIRNKTLSDKEALFYKKLYSGDEQNKGKIGEHKQTRRRWRGGRNN
ncbi:MAG TPA: hypothetical protein PLX23_02710 [Candidatus Hydrogenedens sp.]|nr:hypothetical protein [Candidatus Hydrogenedens sp.]